MIKRKGMMRIGWPILALLVLAGCKEAKTPDRVVHAGSIAVTDGLEVSGGGLYLVEGSPGVLFGTLKRDNRKREYCYLLLFKSNFGPAIPAKSSQSCKSDGNVATSRSEVEIEGRKIELTYKIQLDPTRKTAPNETLTVNGKSLTPRAGRLFVADLTTSPVQWQKMQIRLPDDLPKPNSVEAVEQLAQECLLNLVERNADVRGYFE